MIHDTAEKRTILASITVPQRNLMANRSSERMAVAYFGIDRQRSFISIVKATILTLILILPG
jgi:hypothetical protein